MPLLTKSRFKKALECPSKLFYSTRENGYMDQQVDDPFLAALAEGGYQVGELAKYLFCDDPVTAGITIEALDYESSLSQTEARRAVGGKVVIAEAAFRHQQLFVRTDLVVEEGNRIDIYEVKAKSWDDSTTFLKSNSRGPSKGKPTINKDWAAYLYDIAFQKYVVQQSNPGKKVYSHIILADKTKKTSLDGLNQLFKINRKGDRIQIAVVPGTDRSSLGEIPLKVIQTDEVCDWIYTNPVAVDLKGEWSFEDLVKYFSAQLQSNTQIWSSCLGTKCKQCQYVNEDYPTGPKSGFHECWKKLAKLKDADFKKTLSLDIWGGKGGNRSFAGEAVARELYFLEQLDRTDLTKKDWVEPEGDTLDAGARRLLQVAKTKFRDYKPHIDRDGLEQVFESLPAPYHFIDFETTAVAIPFHKDRRPYEAIAFQYSYHRMDSDGSIRHANQFLSFEKGIFPNYSFLRQLRSDLSGKGGTIFRYHHHENNYLNHIYSQLLEEKTGVVPDRDELLNFIREIATPTSSAAEKWTAINPMQDLYELVLKHFYSLHAGGSNSIKDILPAIIHSSEFLREKYSKPVYATAEIPSLNFSDPHTWIDEKKDLNPYKTLPELFTDIDKTRFDLEDSSLLELNNGGAAMMAYAYLQYTDLPDDQRTVYKDGLLRYCELDTMAMVMIWEYWKKEIER